MRINNPKVFWTIIVLLVIASSLIATKITGYDIDNPDESKDFVTTVLFVGIFGVILLILLNIPKKK